MPDIVYDVLKSPGQRLDRATRELMESDFRYDFSGVRIHTDTRAGESAQSISARAYTVGTNIVFGRDRHRPDTDAGKKLLKHELTHVIQQGEANWTSAAGKLQLEPNAALEDEANRAERSAFSANNIQARQGIALYRRSLEKMEASSDTAAEQPSKAELTDDDLIDAGLIAFGKVLYDVGKKAESFREFYHQGLEIIDQRRAALQSARVPERAIAEQIAEMRKQHALEVRELSGSVLKKGAEWFDKFRGNMERPGYAMLRAKGKSDAEILARALKTNAFVNAFPGIAKSIGRAAWITSAGISVKVIISASPDERASVATREVGGLAGGAGGVAACIYLGLATGGIGLFVCGAFGAWLGTEGARRGVAKLSGAALERDSPNSTKREREESKLLPQKVKMGSRQ